MHKFLLLLLAVTLLAGCKKIKDDEVRFEIALTEPLATQAPGIRTSIGLNFKTHTDFTSGKSWTKELDSKAGSGMLIELDPGELTVTNTCSGTCSIYLNGNRVAHVVGFSSTPAPHKITFGKISYRVP